MTKRTVWRLSLGALAVLFAACSKNPTPQTTTPAVDSAAIRARADSLAAAARRDSIARADSLARARADSVSRSAGAREDSVRAQILRDSIDAANATPSGLDAAGNATLLEALYFETDHSDLSTEARALLDRKLALFRANPRLEVQVEGHADERGPDEYNLALGNRRAAAVKRYLTEHGIADARLTIVSYGEERPADQGNNEAAWAHNRRAEFRVTRSAR